METLSVSFARSKSYVEAVHWYEKAYDAHNDVEDTGTYGCTSQMGMPQHTIRAKMAELYLEGDDDLEKDPSYAGKNEMICVSVHDSALGDWVRGNLV